MLVYHYATTHLSIQLVQLAQSENISIFGLPPGKNSTSLPQPINKIIPDLANAFSTIAYDLSYTKANYLADSKDFPQILQDAMNVGWKKETIKAAFEDTGM